MFRTPGISESHLLSSCSWDGRPFPCSSLFRQVPTDSGICCAFNGESALRQSEYSDLVKEMSGNGGEEEGLRKATLGLEQGLTVRLDQHSGETTFGTVLTDINAFKIWIGSSAEFPVLRRGALMVEPGREHFVELSGVSVAASEDLRGLPVEDRNCMFQDEGELEMYSRYTYTNCVFECKLKLAAKLTGCVPWYLPQAQNSTACHPWMAEKFYQAMKGQGVQVSRSI